MVADEVVVVVFFLRVAGKTPRGAIPAAIELRVVRAFFGAGGGIDLPKAAVAFITARALRDAAPLFLGVEGAFFELLLVAVFGGIFTG